MPAGHGRRELNAEYAKSFVDGLDWNWSTADLDVDLQLTNASASRVR